MVIYFDTEFYVPKDDRKYQETKLTINPTLEKHHLLGGVFARGGPFPKIENLQIDELWLWDQDSYLDGDIVASEKELLKKISRVFDDEYNFLKKKYGSVSLHTVGLGIARFDLPALFIRATRHRILSDERLYRLFLSGFPIDLSNTGAGLVPSESSFNLKPERTNNLMEYYDIHLNKKPGSHVWDLFDEYRYEQIEDRTKSEVLAMIELYNKMKNNKVEKFNNSS